MRPVRLAVLTALLLATASPAFADATIFIGGTTTPTTRQARGFAVGFGLLFLGFEFEYANTSEDLAQRAPNLRTAMGNVLLQTPVAIAGFQPYFTVGGGGYREQLDALDVLRETQFGMNTGGGVKISLIGPLRVRVDYRVFTLKGAPLYDVVHRLYIGANLNF
jgi:opacity protein-like surface antigen